MSRTAWQRLRRLLKVAAPIVAVVAVEAIVVGAIYRSERAGLRAREGSVSAVEAVENYWYPYPVPGVVRPRVVEAAVAGLDAAEPVIGIEINGRARAYRLAALRERSRHVVNDVVGGVPASVAYCDITDCLSGYTGVYGSEPLDISIAGLNNGEMVIKTGGLLYIQKTGRAFRPGEGATAVPLRRIEPRRTTWGEWTRLHPRTDVYTGDPPR